MTDANNPEPEQDQCPQSDNWDSQALRSSNALRTLLLLHRSGSADMTTMGMNSLGRSLSLLAGAHMITMEYDTYVITPKGLKLIETIDGENPEFQWANAAEWANREQAPSASSVLNLTRAFANYLAYLDRRLDTSQTPIEGREHIAAARKSLLKIGDQPQHRRRRRIPQ